MYPLKRKNNSKWKHWKSWNKTHVIVGIWVLGTAISLPEYLAFAELPFCYNNLLYYECRNTWPDQIANPYTIFIFLSTFAIPLALLSYLYTSIGLKLWRRQMPGNVDVNRDLTMQTKRAKVVKMLLVVVVLFAVMWLPLQTFSMVNFLYPDIRGNTEYASLGYNIFVGTYFACHWLGMAHSCVSPLVYCFMNKKFRTDLRNLLCPLRALVGGASHNGLTDAGSKCGLYESYNSATFRTSGHNQNHSPAHPKHNSMKLRGGSGGSSGNTHWMNSNSNTNSVRVRASSGTHQSVSRQLSKTNSLSSLRTSSRLGPQTSNELRKSSSQTTESDLRPQLQPQPPPPPSPAPQAGGPSNQVDEILEIHTTGNLGQSESGRDFPPKAHNDPEVAPPSSLDSATTNVQTTSPTIVKMKMVQNSLFERQVLMSKLSETSASETLHEIDEESEEEDEEDENEDEEDDNLNGETGSGRMVTIRHHECEYAILEPTTANAKVASLPSSGSGGGGSHEHMANV